ncbi:hypothetical protein L3X38_035100 [Prunus dulcis]|uniref:Uncharacterized protein n=1 Tax=Prunus dulcis TaxID=3755 RepID=A0AAD4VLC8_PRUDU|nr:hypothetical protein L3X38_035100 [Prunus dulcis]
MLQELAKPPPSDSYGQTLITTAIPHPEHRDRTQTHRLQLRRQARPSPTVLPSRFRRKIAKSDRFQAKFRRRCTPSSGTKSVE